MDAVKIENAEPVEILGLHAIEFTGFSQSEIRQILESEIQQRTGIYPSTLRVQILKTDTEYESIISEYLASLRSMLDGTCPTNYEGLKSKSPPINRSLDEQIKRIRRIEMAEVVV